MEPGILAKHVETGPGVPPFEISLDDDSSQTFNEQIIAKIKEAIARGRLRAGERLPSVRGLADRLGVAPGTVARAYADLSRQGVLEGDRVKGARVPPGGPDRPDAVVSRPEPARRPLRAVRNRRQLTPAGRHF